MGPGQSLRASVASSGCRSRCVRSWRLTCLDVRVRLLQNDLRGCGVSVQLSLTDFVDIVAASGTPKATKVRRVVDRPEYSPAFDFYKKLRDQIVSAHQHDRPKSALDSALSGLTDRKKQTAYPELVDAYKKWWGRKSLGWFAPQTLPFSRGPISVSVNPELGLDVNGERHLVKLYFKKDPLAKNKVDVITHLMAVVLSSRFPGVTMSVLDVRSSRLISPTVPIDGLDAMINGEMAYIDALVNG